MEKQKINDWVLILNPHAGGGKGAKDKDKIIRLLKRKGFEIKLFISEYPKHIISLTSDLITNGHRKIIMAGGDGSLNEVVNGIFSQDKIPPEEITVGMIPVGTGNDWIKTFGIPNNYKKAVKRIVKGKTILQDVGKISYEENGMPGVNFFANMAGFGFDALVAEKANALKNKGRKGFFVYLQSLAAGFIQFRICKTRIQIDREEINELIFSASIGIGKYNGGGMMQAPGAVPDNGEFQVTLIRKIGIWGILRNIIGLYDGTFIKDRRVSTHSAKYVKISSAFTIAGEADGETLGNHSFEIEIIPQKLNVVRGKNPEFVIAR
ncbi:MAG: diacylglycerol kinase family lipid kinase [Prolixibacteraceae bacterium]|jgi:YegS/Rv2252/BmrU family lipid kinase|nr:diacylglycerol kinase family lipid kinase [Prolixibacteraceae bacterium]